MKHETRKASQGIVSAAESMHLLWKLSQSRISQLQAPMHAFVRARVPAKEEAWRWFWQCVEPLLDVKLPLGQCDHRAGFYFLPACPVAMV